MHLEVGPALAALAIAKPVPCAYHTPYVCQAWCFYKVVLPAVRAFVCEFYLTLNYEYFSWISLHCLVPLSVSGNAAARFLLPRVVVNLVVLFTLNYLDCCVQIVDGVF